eukprot:1179255-Heterocapsa_arctica.AAC.1
MPSQCVRQWQVCGCVRGRDTASKVSSTGDRFSRDGLLAAQQFGQSIVSRCIAAEEMTEKLALAC